MTNDSPTPAIRSSEYESSLTGLSVGRLSYGLGHDVSPRDVVANLEAADFDLIIVRYPAEWVAMASILGERMVAWQADTLMYLSADVRTMPPPALEFRRSNAGEVLPELERVVLEIFTGYTNHYSASPILRPIDVPAAYADWCMRLAATSSAETFVLRSSSGDVVAFAALDVEHPEANELMLVGVHPNFRGRGVMAEVIRHVADLTRAQGKDLVFTSTQASNIAGLRSYCRQGFLPILALNTMHVYPRGVPRERSGD